MAASGADYPGAYPVPPPPVSMPARLYPANDLANQTQMNTPVQGAGTCTFSNGARYKLHVGG